MSVTKVLLDILVVLVAAKIASEGAERIGVPAVVGEIVSGVLIGPSMLGLVHGDEVLRVLGELGVILLLLDVGLAMDVGELAAVGRAALSVATIGVVVPLAAGMAAAIALGLPANEALFVGAALTATSVGITARVFGDLRLLATAEARTVLGAAVADDVMGLVILTVVTRLASQGSVSVSSVATVVAVAIAFLALASIAGIRIAPWAFEHVGRLSRSPGTLVALSLAFTLAMAELANAARLAPIVGAFVAGLALSRSKVAPRVRRELTPVGHLLIPVFFLQIGIDADVAQFVRPRVIAIASVLIAVAIGGKLVAAIGVGRGSADRLLVGLAMIPRGEVGLIFATLGLSEGILGRDLYAALLLVVLVTTLVTPPLLAWRARRRAEADARTVGVVDDDRPAPPGGWLHHLADPHRAVELAAPPSRAAALEVAFTAANAVANGAPAGDELVRWLTQLPRSPLPWTGSARTELSRLLAEGDAKAWRFLLVTGVLDRALPELADALRRRQDNPFEIDPTRWLSWPRLAQVNVALESARPGLAGAADDLARLAAVLLDVSDADPDVDSAAQLVDLVATRVGLDDHERTTLALLVSSATMLPAAARRLDGLDEEPVVQLASHLGTRATADLAWIVAATTTIDELGADRLAALRVLVTTVLEHPEHSGVGATNVVDARRADALAAIPSAAERIAATPRAFVLSQTAADLARQAALADPPLRRGQVRAAVSPGATAGEWRIDIAVADAVGLLAQQLAVFRDLAMRVVDVATVLWPDGQSLSTFRVESGRRPNGDQIADAVAATLPAPVSPMALPGAEVRFDDDSSPWHTICTVVNDDQSEALLAVAKAVALCDVNVVAARGAVDGVRRLMVLELADGHGARLVGDEQDRIRGVLATGEPPTGRRRAARRRPT